MQCTRLSFVCLLQKFYSLARGPTDLLSEWPTTVASCCQNGPLLLSECPTAAVIAVRMSYCCCHCCQIGLLLLSLLLDWPTTAVIAVRMAYCCCHCCQNGQLLLSLLSDWATAAVRMAYCCCHCWQLFFTQIFVPFKGIVTG